MQRFWFFTIYVSFFFNITTAQPTLSPVLVEQVPGTKEVRIVYDLGHSGGLSSTVSVMVSRDGGGSFLDPISLSGAVGPGITPGNGKEILWEVGQDWPAEEFSGVIVRLTADDGSGEVIPADMVEVHGGILGMSMGTLEVGSFFIGRYEVTWREWLAVRAWAVANGYDLNLRGEGCSEDHPVMEVNWYDVVKWCNAKSEMEGLTPVYRVNEVIYRTGDFGRMGSDAVSWDTLGNGYRLPSEAEWEFAARGGSLTKGYIYSGSDNLNEVGWYWDNSAGGICDLANGRGPIMVGRKAPNELGLYDMSGNVWEWCWDAVSTNRRIRGGAWNLPENGCTVSNRLSDSPSYRSSYGFRLAGSMDPTVFDRDHSMDFPSFDLDLTDSIPSGLWDEAERYANGWSSLPWFGYFFELELGWIYHLEHGYQYFMGESLQGIIVFDLAMHSWFWISESLYPYFYKFGANEGWYWYYKGGTFGQRWFYRMADHKDLQEHTINDVSAPFNMVLVQGGTLAMSMGTVTVDSFEIGTHEVTWGQWKTVRSVAIANGYDIGSRGQGCADDHPVRSVNWYDVIKWSNAKSQMEGRTPVYSYNGFVYKSGEPDHTAIEQNLAANGYRLPQEAEWEFAARGGTQTSGYTYSGSNDLNAVGWFWDNSGGAACPLSSDRGTWPVGQKAANELGLYDMSGNVWEWCWDQSSSSRHIRGGGWSSYTSNCTVSYRGILNPDGRNNTYGFRPARTPSP